MLDYAKIYSEVMNDTCEKCKEIDSLKSSIQDSINQEYIVYRNDTIEVNPIKNENMKIIVSSDRTFEAAKKYIGKKVCCLDFANDSYIGGSPWHAGAQEECMCRASTLYPCLSAKKKEFYEKHMGEYREGELNFMGCDDLIYVPNVVIFKTDECIPQLKPKDCWYKSDVIVCAAPIIRRNTSYNMEEYRRVMETRIKRIIDVASKENVEVLILGAFGCGAFGNPPEVVADIFNSLIRNYNFEIVEFAVFCRNDFTNYEIFKNTFK